MATEDEILARFLEAQDRLVFQASDLSLGTIANMVQRGAIDVNPSYQRRERWSIDKQAALIESFLLNVPVPPVYLTEDEYGKYSVVDGKQRITTINSFMSGSLALVNLEAFREIEGLRYGQLPTDLKNALDVRPYIRVITLLKQSDPTLKYEVFTRLNRGGESMEPQELRNVAFRGPLNDLIYELSKNSFLKKALKIKDGKSSAFQNMTDAELVLRFLTMRTNWNRFSGDYRQEMDYFMLKNRFSKMDKLKEYRHAFSRSIQACEEIWGDAAFKRPFGDSWRDQLLTGMYDAQMVAVDLLNETELNNARKKSDMILEKTRDLFEDRNFETSVRQGTNTPGRVSYRVQRVKSILY